MQFPPPRVFRRGCRRWCWNYSRHFLRWRCSRRSARRRRFENRSDWKWQYRPRTGCAAGVAAAAIATNGGLSQGQCAKGRSGHGIGEGFRSRLPPASPFVPAPPKPPSTSAVAVILPPKLAVPMRVPTVPMPPAPPEKPLPRPAPAGASRSDGAERDTAGPDWCRWQRRFPFRRCRRYRRQSSRCRLRPPIPWELAKILSVEMRVIEALPRAPFPAAPPLAVF